MKSAFYPHIPANEFVRYVTLTVEEARVFVALGVASDTAADWDATDGHVNVAFMAWVGDYFGSSAATYNEDLAEIKAAVAALGAEACATVYALGGVRAVRAAGRTG